MVTGIGLTLRYALGLLVGGAIQMLLLLLLLLYGGRGTNVEVSTSVEPSQKTTWFLLTGCVAVYFKAATPSSPKTTSTHPYTTANTDKSREGCKQWQIQRGNEWKASIMKLSHKTAWFLLTGSVATDSRHIWPVLDRKWSGITPLRTLLSTPSYYHSSSEKFYSHFHSPPFCHHLFTYLFFAQH